MFVVEIKSTTFFMGNSSIIYEVIRDITGIYVEGKKFIRLWNSLVGNYVKAYELCRCQNIFISIVHTFIIIFDGCKNTYVRKKCTFCYFFEEILKKVTQKLINVVYIVSEK